MFKKKSQQYNPYPEEKKAVNVLFVCMGNICRSPTAHGVFRHLVEQQGLSQHIYIDSAGTHAYHVGEPPDPRALSTAVGRGIDMGDLRARRAVEDDFDYFNYVLAMDHDNYAILEGISPPDRLDRLSLFMDFAPQLGEREVPDPYYGGSKGFERVFEMIEAASQGLLNDIRQRHLK
ncbi:MAG: low molecular weight protein-tyrosine-phosphatase [Gammaproteobacteria bacterium]